MAQVNLYLKAPPGNGYTTSQAMKRVDDHLAAATPAKMKCSSLDGMPIQEADGTWEVKVLVPFSVSLVKLILIRHYGLEIIREETIE